MHIKEEHITKFKVLWRNYGGTELTDSQARDQLGRLLHLVKTVYRARAKRLAKVDNYSTNHCTHIDQECACSQDS